MDRAPGSFMSGGYVLRTAPKQRPALARATVGIGCRVAKRDAHAMRARQHVRTSCVELREAAHGSGCSAQRRAAPCWRRANGRMPTRSPKRRRARVEGELCRGSTLTLDARPRVHTLGVMVARAWSGLMCLETQGTRGGAASAGSGRRGRGFDPRPILQYLHKRGSALEAALAAGCSAARTRSAFGPKRGDLVSGHGWPRGEARRASSRAEEQGSERRRGVSAWPRLGETEFRN